LRYKNDSRRIEKDGRAAVKREEKGGRGRRRRKEKIYMMVHGHGPW
jgi:hypothetical protein